MSQTGSRISKPVFVGTSSALLAVCLTATLVRFYIRFLVQREIGWDDGALIFGVCCLIAGMAVLYTMIDLMYEMEAIAAASIGAPIPDITLLPPEAVAMVVSMISKSVRYRKLSAVASVHLWAAICSVKFSFLALFRKLLRQMPAMMRYWWFVLSFNVAISLYGALVFIVACPYFKEKDIMKTLQCTSGSGLATTFNHSMAQMILDIVGDLLILVIPVILLWQIRIRLSQKIALGLTLCLTIVMIIITAARMIGLKHDNKLDYILEIFFIVLAAEIGLVLVAITAFRALYVSKVKDRSHETVTTFNWYHRSKMTFFKIIDSVSRKSRSTGTDSIEMEKGGNGGYLKGTIPRGTMTGVRTFIHDNGNESVDNLVKKETANAI